MKRLYILLILIFCHHTISAQWQQTSGPGGGYISSFASNGNNLFVATTLGGVGYYGAGVFLSIDNGATWTPKNSGMLCTGIYTLLTNGTSIFAGTDNGIFTTNNNGNSWSQLSNGLPSTYVTSLILDGTSIIAATYDSGMFVSNNNGVSWSPINMGIANPEVWALASNGSEIYAGVNGVGLYKSINNGASVMSIQNCRI